MKRRLCRALTWGRATKASALAAQSLMSLPRQRREAPSYQGARHGSFGPAYFFLPVTHGSSTYPTAIAMKFKALNSTSTPLPSRHRDSPTPLPHDFKTPLLSSSSSSTSPPPIEPPSVAPLPITNLPQSSLPQVCCLSFLLSLTYEICCCAGYLPSL